MRKTFVVLFAVVAWVMLPVATASAMPSADVATATPIKHMVMLMQDNHSFDNYFGTYPGADGIPEGVCQRLSLSRASTQGCIEPFRLGDQPAEDLSHGVGIQKRQYNEGKMDGFVAAYRRLGRDGTTAMGYYDGADLPYYWNVADDYVLFDRFFSSTAVGSRESYLYWLAAKAPVHKSPISNSGGYNALPTIFDRLQSKNVSAKFYVESLDARATSAAGKKHVLSSQDVKVPLLSMKRFQDEGPLAGKIVDLSQYYVDLRTGSLPAVSYIVTTGSSENPTARVNVGQETVRKLTSELIRSRYWRNSAFMWTYDGWGGWYDHVPPPRVDSDGYGFRVPALLMSPYAKRGFVDHSVLDYTSMLKFIESNWGVEPLAERDAGSPGLMSAFDFGAPPRPAALVASDRNPEVTAQQTKGNAKPVIYSVYGAALTAVVAMIALSVYVKRPFDTLRPVAVLRKLQAQNWAPIAGAASILRARGASLVAAPTRPSNPKVSESSRRNETLDGRTSEWEHWYQTTQVIDRRSAEPTADRSSAELTERHDGLPSTDTAGPRGRRRWWPWSGSA